ncbi:hypothetical protein BC835DRAFT_572152 [Cytidiella melzeri]|nr:hypothetical protein BC835DRAFT_572152 [Cytidiella melzeri]
MHRIPFLTRQPCTSHFVRSYYFEPDVPADKIKAKRNAVQRAVVVGDDGKEEATTPSLIRPWTVPLEQLHTVSAYSMLPTSTDRAVFSLYI